MKLTNRFVTGAAIALLVLVADQVVKWQILLLLRPPGATGTPFAAPDPIHVLPILDFALVWNRGISFGIGNGGSGAGTYVFAAIAIVVALALLGWMARTKRMLLAVALGLVIGGAIGNLVDRLRIGAVVDFLSVHIGGFDWWPAFNLADSAITVGAVLLVIDSLFGARE